MATDMHMKGRILLQYFHHLVQGGNGLRKNFITVLIKENVLGGKVYFLYHFFTDHRTTIILFGAGFIRTLIFLIIEAISIGIRNRAAFILCYTGFVWTGIHFIIDTILIGIRDGAAIVFRQSGNGGALVFCIVKAIFICIRYRTALIFSQTRLVWTFICSIRNAISVFIRAALCGHCSGYRRAGILIIWHTIF